MLCLYWSLIEFWHLQQQSIHTVKSVRPVNLGKPWINSISYCVGLCSGVHMLNMPIQANFYHILYCLSIVNIIRIKNTDWMKRFMQMKLTPNHTQNLACLCECVYRVLSLFHCIDDDLQAIISIHIQKRSLFNNRISECILNDLILSCRYKSYNIVCVCGKFSIKIRIKIDLCYSLYRNVHDRFDLVWSAHLNDLPVPLVR